MRQRTRGQIAALLTSLSVCFGAFGFRLSFRFGPAADAGEGRVRLPLTSGCSDEQGVWSVRTVRLNKASILVIRPRRWLVVMA